ncbi:MAG: tripartite tricarboxylate transporter family receptor [Hyphomicrobiales bacterium]|nr:tripartite tricarboxylate transporter family receptor [Hyphomicrobiales bacterium]
MTRWLGFCLGLFLALNGPASARADDSVQRFFAGKTVRVIVGYPPGSTFDTYARILVRHMGRHLPGNPNLIVQNMPGAGGLTATSYAANVATADGLTLAMLNPVNTTEPLLQPEVAKFDPSKFSWIGSMNREVGTCAFWGSKVANLADLKTKDVMLGGTGPAAGSTLDAKAIQALLGLRFRMVLGYPGLLEVRHAAEQGEVDGFCGLLVSSLKVDVWDQFKAGTFKVLLQTGLTRHPDLPSDVPNVFDLAPDEETKNIMRLVFAPWAYGRPVMAPANVPSDRLAALRQAFASTLADPVFKEEAAKTNLEIQEVGPDEIARIVADIYATPQATVERTRSILGITR